MTAATRRRVARRLIARVRARYGRLRPAALLYVALTKMQDDRTLPLGEFRAKHRDVPKRDDLAAGYLRALATLALIRAERAGLEPRPRPLKR